MPGSPQGHLAGGEQTFYDVSVTEPCATWLAPGQAQ
jgi:hypothetical protein